jgi:1-acyl-sn-glycerol-3-phosphate acyltransferase
MRVGIRIGKPLDFSRYEGMENDRFVLRSMTDELMYELMELSGQEYVDMYSARAKEVESGDRSSRNGAPAAEEDRVAVDTSSAA